MPRRTRPKPRRRPGRDNAAPVYGPPPTTDQLARRLVERGLSSPRILGFRPDHHHPTERNHR